MSGRIILAPMEGVVDSIMRDVLTRLGGIDQCVTEFIRVTDRLLPDRVFLRHAPELENAGRTAAGVPVVVQLLGCSPGLLAMNALRAAKLGAPGIDLNFGCPSKTVNRHRGGAVMLETPEDIHEIVKAVRIAVPANIPVTAKMRLGYKCKSKAIDNAQAIADAGADGLIVHARTKLEGYKPPAHWEWIAQIRGKVDIPVTANGEVWTWDDYQRCRDLSGCEDVMIGRGLIARPHLAASIKSHQQGAPYATPEWHDVLGLLTRYFGMIEQRMPKDVMGRMKQWLNMMKRDRPEAAELFERIKLLRNVPQLRAVLLADHCNELTGHYQQAEMNFPTCSRESPGDLAGIRAG